MSDNRTLLCVALLASSLCSWAGCVTPETKTNLNLVGSSRHVPYPAKPEYLGTRALPDPATLKRIDQAAGIHVSAPAIDDKTGDDSDPGVAESAGPGIVTAVRQPGEAGGGALTVAPSDEAPLPNREPDAPEPNIQPRNPPQDPP